MKPVVLVAFAGLMLAAYPLEARSDRDAGNMAEPLSRSVGAQVKRPANSVKPRAKMSKPMPKPAPMPSRRPRPSEPAATPPDGGLNTNEM